MPRQAITTGSKFEEMAGYSRAIVDGEWIFISGTAGYDFSNGTISEEPVEQARQCLATIEGTLREAGADMSDVVRVRLYLSDRSFVESVARELGSRFAPPRPTNTTIICGFATPEMKVEIEVTALKRAS
ncbi:MAG: RidA family protein [Pseudomonadota bacterium]